MKHGAEFGLCLKQCDAAALLEQSESTVTCLPHTARDVYSELLLIQEPLLFHNCVYINLYSGV